MADNKMAVKPMYKCGICDSVHETIEKRMNCEQKCLKEQKEKAKKAAEAEAKAKRDAEYKEVCDAIAKAEKFEKEAEKLKKAFIKKHGYFSYSNSTQEEDEYEDDLYDFLRKFGWMLP